VRLEKHPAPFQGWWNESTSRARAAELGTGYPEPGKIGVMPAYGLFARHIRNLELANIRTSFETEDLRPATNVWMWTDWKLTASQAQTRSRRAGGKIDSVKNVVIRNSPMLEGIPLADDLHAGFCALPSWNQLPRRPEHNPFLADAPLTLPPMRITFTCNYYSIIYKSGWR